MHCRMQTLFCHDTTLPFYDAYIATIFKYLQYRFICIQYTIPRRMHTAVRKYIYIYIFVHVFLNYIYMCKYIILFFIYTTSHHMMQYCNKLCSYGTTSTNAVSHGATQYCKILVHILFHFCTTCLPSINKING